MDKGTTCEHLDRISKYLVGLELEKESLECHSCYCPGPNLWVCLHADETGRCLHVGCSENDEDHSTLHQMDVPSHCIHMNISTDRIWCYSCCKEVSLGAAFARNKVQSSEVSSVGGSSISKLVFDRRVGLNVTLVDGDEDEEINACNAERNEDSRGLVGLQNMGNTCYMNAALQALSNTLPLTSYFMDCEPVLDVIIGENKATLTRAYQKLITEMWTRSTRGSVVPNGILYGIRLTHPMFRGYHQHDAQEFLRCFMDQLHEELKEPTRGCSPSESGGGDKPSRRRAASAGASDANLFARARRKSPATASLSECTTDGYQRFRNQKGHTRTQSYSHTPRSANSASESDLSGDSEGDNEQFETCSSSSETNEPSYYFRGEFLTDQNSGTIQYRSIVSDVFDGKLLSSVQCLVCDRVSTRVETFQDLSLPIPSREHIALLRTHHEATSHDSWLWWLLSWLRTWLYGPVVTLQDCLAAFFSADELKGDNMYSCSRCNKLREGVKLSGVIRLPEVLCVHLKRFRHELMFSCKLGARVAFPLHDLDMKPYLHKDCESKITKYELAGVIVHSGTAAGGHYTCVARTPGGSWYLYDDSCVTRVSPQYVAAQEAYVLLYRKVNPQMCMLRQKAAEIAETASDDGMQFYISKQWLNKFKTWSEPGPVDNSDFVCPHGRIRPDRAADLTRLAIPAPQHLWELLREKFGGGPACSHAGACATCAARVLAAKRRRRAEHAAFSRLHAQFQEQDSPSAVYALSMSWFRAWQSFVRGKCPNPPPAVDNKPIAQRQESNDSTGTPTYTLKKGSDYAQISEDLWCFFTKIYGGGPEIKLRTTPNDLVTSTRSSSDTDDHYANYLAYVNNQVNGDVESESTRNAAKRRVSTETVNSDEDVPKAEVLMNGHDSSSDNMEVELPIENINLGKSARKRRSSSNSRGTVK